MARQADWYFDFISPFPYLQLARFDRLPADLEVRPAPVLFAGLLEHWGNLGPAEIPAKRRQTYRYCHWLASRRGLPFRTPPRHPFRPLPLLRLAVALDGDLAAVRAIFAYVWGEGRDAQDMDGLRELAASLGVDDLDARIADPAVKRRLHDNTAQAVAAGVFGVPSFVVDGEVFWGDDATEMLLDHLSGSGAALPEAEFERLADLPVGVARPQSRL